MGKRGQVSLEYLMIMGFSLFMIAVLMVVYGQTQAEQQYQVTDSQVNRIGKKIISAAEEVYYLGEPSRKRVTVYMPSNVMDITITPKELLFQVELASSLNDQEFATHVNLTGQLTYSEGIKNIDVLALPGPRVCLKEDTMNESVC